MKKIMLSAYVNNNLGDDLFLKILCERFPYIKFIIFTPQKTVFLKSFNNLHASTIGYYIDEISYKIFRRLFATKILSFFVNSHVHIGGSLFIENDKWKRKFHKYSLKVNSFSNNFLLGCNFGPFKKDEYLNSYKELFKVFNDISFRDTKSLKLFHDIDNARVSPDIVLSYSNNYEKTPKSIGISIINLSDRKELLEKEEIYLNNLKEIIINYASKGYTIKLFSFCEEEGDLTAANNLLNRVSYLSDEVEIVNYSGDIDYFLKEFNSMEIVVASRFHAMILGLVQSSSVIPIAYSEKMINTLDDLKYEGTVKSIKSLFENDYEEIIFSLEKENNLIDMTRYSQEAKQHFKILDKHLKE
ncbi:hypothetical protein AUC31_14970 [Planococcus rifietoensis]|uniref:Polysaccharide pyruvyl transferase domain-containing protein n=1 Tax=Planococcus rifietoensis TaxID=200991 RepID=A0A0U2ZGN1_9BACL|nr:polysaccharide pyruvyl transferase family protein [Planococcus rifietoensis]ALS76421.1 hypothetical protein AUC31_14970 [Planococcus rifietoensis]